MSRALTPEELRRQFMDEVQAIARVWSDNYLKANSRGEPTTVLDVCEGVAFSMLCLIDGVKSLPAFDLVARPNHDDKQFHADEGSNYIEDGTVINNDIQLHQSYYCKAKNDPGLLKQ